MGLQDYVPGSMPGFCHQSGPREVLSVFVDLLLTANS